MCSYTALYSIYNNIDYIYNVLHNINIIYNTHICLYITNY